jgi:hypothetical protein
MVTEMLTFKRNMGTLDRSIRILVGIILLTLGPATEILTLTTIPEILLGIVGTLALVSGLSAYCILYEFTGSNTKNNKT